MYPQVKSKTTDWSFSWARFTWWFQYVYECPMILLLKLFYSQGDMYFWWPITCKQLLNNLRVNMLTSVVNYDSSVKAHVSNTSDHSLYSGICWLHNCVFGWSISEKNGQKLFYYLIMELFTDLKSAVLEWCMLHNTFHLTFLTMHKFQSFKLIREPYLLELKIVF